MVPIIYRTSLVVLGAICLALTAVLLIARSTAMGNVESAIVGLGFVGMTLVALGFWTEQVSR